MRIWLRRLRIWVLKIALLRVKGAIEEIVIKIIIKLNGKI
jgi:hypothetical protein